ncbi:hypothetical protein D3C87_1483090 [compost metagenome]
MSPSVLLRSGDRFNVPLKKRAFKSEKLSVCAIHPPSFRCVFSIAPIVKVCDDEDVKLELLGDLLHRIAEQSDRR